MIYEVNEIFASIQGEGCFTGHPVSFIRFAGCNLSCAGCDTAHSDKRMRMNVQDVIDALEGVTGHFRMVVLTGGEPTTQDLKPLLRALRSGGYSVNLETNGYNLKAYVPGAFDWVAFSPKIDNCTPKAFQFAGAIVPDEIKIIVRKEEELLDINKRRSEVLISSARPHWWLQPWMDSDMEAYKRLISEITPFALLWGWGINIQTHKLVNWR